MKSEYRVSLEVAKQLKEAGYKQEGCDRYWHIYLKCVDSISGEHPTTLVDSIYINDSKWNVFYAAPCVGRLGEELLELDNYVNGDIKYKDTYYWVGEEAFENEADARALMWIELKQKGLL